MLNHQILSLKFKENEKKVNVYQKPLDGILQFLWAFLPYSFKDCSSGVIYASHKIFYYILRSHKVDTYKQRTNTFSFCFLMKNRSQHVFSVYTEQRIVNVKSLLATLKQYVFEDLLRSPYKRSLLHKTYFISTKDYPENEELEIQGAVIRSVPLCVF